MRILAVQPESMAGSMAGALTLEPMGAVEKGGAFWPAISLIFKLSQYSKQAGPYNVRKLFQEKYIVF